MSPSQLRALSSPPRGRLRSASDAEVSVASEAVPVAGGAGLFAALTRANRHTAKRAAAEAMAQPPKAKHSTAMPQSAPGHAPLPPPTAGAAAQLLPPPPPRVPSTAAFDGTPLHSAAASVNGAAVDDDVQLQDSPLDMAEPLVAGWLLLARTTTTAAAAGDADLLTPQALAEANDAEASYRLALCPGTRTGLHKVWAALFRGTYGGADGDAPPLDLMVLWATRAEGEADIAVNKEYALAAQDSAQEELFELHFPSAVDVRPLADCQRMLPGLSDAHLHVRANPEESVTVAGFLPEPFTADGQAVVELTGEHAASMQPQLFWRMAFRVPAHLATGEDSIPDSDISLGYLPTTVAALGCSDSGDWLAWVGCLSALTGTDIRSWGEQ